MRRLAILVLSLTAACNVEDGAPAGADAPTTGESTLAETSGSGGAATSAATDESGDEDGSSGGDEGEPLPTPTGPELYQSLCAGCHGLEGEGTMLGYELRHPDRELSTHVIRTGREGVEFEDAAMAAYGEDVFSDQQLEELYDWLDAFDQPTTGEALYADYCANCHGADPLAGGVIDKDIADKDLDDTLEKVRDGEGAVGDRRDRYMSAFDEDRLSDDELQAIIDWM